MSQKPDVVDLELVSTPDLAAELLKRGEHGAVVLHRSSHGEQIVFRQFRGNSYAVMGLCQKMIFDVAGDLRGREAKGEL